MMEYLEKLMERAKVSETNAFEAVKRLRRRRRNESFHHENWTNH